MLHLPAEEESSWQHSAVSNSATAAVGLSGKTMVVVAGLQRALDRQSQS